MPSILGLTGNIASGKSTVGMLLLELGATAYIDADLVVHELYLPGKPLVSDIAAAFGAGVVDEAGGVNRRALGDIVFGDAARLRQLESIVLPHVRDALLARLRALPASGIGVFDAIKLVESGYAPLCDGVWLVTCSEEAQMRRLMTSRGLTETEARQRIAAQPDLEPKRAAATEIITNDGTLDDLRREVGAAWERFRAEL
ncbi:MAG: dephospho-CoA kinase [Ktedonobacterales bacterium]